MPNKNCHVVHLVEQLLSFFAPIVALLINSMACCLLATTAEGSPQCNLGLKLFSLEGGRAICAPITPFQCVESCEWINSDENSGCEQSSHYSTFRGRRTFLSGIVLSEQNFFVQCCASLATSVEFVTSNRCAIGVKRLKRSLAVQICDLKECLAQWNIIEVIDPSQSHSDVWADLRTIRYGRSAIKVRAEVCRYSSERAFCERNKMSRDDFHKYSLLLLRLQRTREFVQMKNNVLELNNTAADGNQLNVGSSATTTTTTTAGEDDRKAHEISNQSSDLVRKENRGAIFRNRTKQIGPLREELKANRINRDEQPLVNGGDTVDETLNGLKIVEGFGRRFWGDKEEIVKSPLVARFVNASSSPTANTGPKTTTEAMNKLLTNNLLTKMPMSAKTQATNPFFIEPSSVERMLFNDPRQRQTKHRAQKNVTFSAHKEQSELSVPKAEVHSVNETKPIRLRHHNHEATIGPQHLAVRRIRYPPFGAETPAVARSSDSQQIGGGPRGTQRRRIWPILATNTTKELVPANIGQKWTGEKEQQLTAVGEQQHLHAVGEQQQIRSGSAGKDWHNLRKMNSTALLEEANIRQQKQNFITIRPLFPTTQRSHSPPNHRHELRIKKLSQNPSNEIQTNLALKYLTNENEEQQQNLLSMASRSASGAGGSFASAEPLDEVGKPFPTLSSALPRILPQISTHPLEKAPQFKFISLMEKPPKSTATVARQLSGTTIEGGRAVENGTPSKSAAGERLLECCQRQSAGCRAICTNDVTKEQVKKVMVSGQCPPVTMTGVIQCFPRFYNISTVSKCCAQQNKFGENGAISILQQAKMQNLPLQCLSLCAPNLHLTFAHLACVDHIEHILHCYRQLLEEDNGDSEQRRRIQQQKTTTTSSSTNHLLSLSPFS